MPLSTRGLVASYGGPVVLSGVTFDAEEGERIGVLGPNGGGKSTLFRVLLGELRPLRGSVRRPPRLGFVPQTERSRLDYPVSALDVALMGTLSRVPWWRPVGRTERRAALAALERVGLAALADEQFGEISGGQRQRVLVARALVQDAPVLLLDDLAAEGRGLLVATHDLEQARRFDRVLCLNRRQIAFGPPEETLTLPVLEATYGGAIVALPGAAAAVLPPHHHE